jgi:hypothetical protein
MKPSIVLILIVCTIMSACSSNSAPPAASDTPKITAAEQPVVRSAANAAAPVESVPQPKIPAGARWTILCDTRSGPNHAQAVRQLRAELLRTTSLRDWHIVQGDKHSTLYYGYYRAIRGDDPKEAPERDRAHDNLRQVAAVSDPVSGQRLFRNPFLIALEDADPTAPPAWSLANADGYWSLQILAFRDHAQRKEAAIEAARDLRSQGIEAYYFHGPVISSVCVGAWPREAVREQKSSVASTPNADDVLVVAPAGVNIPEGPITTRDGSNVVVVQQKMDIVDQEMLATLRRFPHHAENYVEAKKVKVNGEWKSVRQPSFFVIIPNAVNQAPTQRADRIQEAEQRPTMPDPWRAQKTAPRSGGKLRGIDD